MVSDPNATPLSTVEAANDTELKKAFTTSKYYDDCCDHGHHGREIEDDIKQLCGSLLNLLEGAAEEPKQKSTASAGEVVPQAEGESPPDKESFVEKCVTFYDRLLDFKYAGNCRAIHCITCS